MIGFKDFLLAERAPDTQDAMKRFKAGKAGFTDKAHLKAKGLIPRSDGTKRKSPKYEEVLDEVLSFAARRKKSIDFRRRKQKLQRQRKIALRKTPSLQRLKSRGRKSARNVLTKRYFGGKSKAGMSIAQKARVEKRLDKSKRLVGVISKRLLPSKRRLDLSRRAGR